MVVSKLFKRLLAVQRLLRWLRLESLRFVHCYYCINQSISVLVYLVLFHRKVLSGSFELCVSIASVTLLVVAEKHLSHSTASLPMIPFLWFPSCDYLGPCCLKNLSLGTDSFPMIIFLSFLHFSTTMMSYYWVLDIISYLFKYIFLYLLFEIVVIC